MELAVKGDMLLLPLYASVMEIVPPPPTPV
jgi:hypothetical protein